VEKVTRCVQELMKLLGPRRFRNVGRSCVYEQRMASAGYRGKDPEDARELPSTGERAFVQVKSNTTSEELAKYVNKLEHPYTRMFYVFHSGEAETADRRVTESLAKLVVDAGLVNWLIHKVS
jgi:hypothetical protein